MGLRARLAIATIAIGLVLALLSTYVRDALHQRFVDETISQLALLHMHTSGRRQCEASPASWGTAWSDDVDPMGPFIPPFSATGTHAPLPGGMPHMEPMPPPGVRRWDVKLYALDANYKAANPNAPPVARALRQALRHEDATAVYHQPADLSCSTQELVRMPWVDGPCAFVLVCRAGGGQNDWHGPPYWEIFGVPLAIALAALLIAMAPVIRRIRRLTDQVQQAAEAGTADAIVVVGSDEIASLGRAFADAQHKIAGHMQQHQARERRLRDFIENTTHDVMIPLTVLQGNLSTLLDQHVRGTSIQSQHINAACNDAHYIASLLHNLAVAAKLEDADPSVSKNPTRIDELIRRACARHQSLAKKQGIELNFGVPEHGVTIMADVTLAEQAISNVIYNAVRYNKAGGHVAVLLEATTGAHVSVSVIDDGPGIEPEAMQAITERYNRGNMARTRVPGGQGLGLHIAERVCAQQGWAMQLKRSEFGGLEVVLTMSAQLADV